MTDVCAMSETSESNIVQQNPLYILTSNYKLLSSLVKMALARTTSNDVEAATQFWPRVSMS
jgi:hypothetical protein